MPDSIQKTKDDLMILTVHEVAEYLCMSEAKVYRLVIEEGLPVVRIGKTCSTTGSANLRKPA
jgi:excisionase family DNA binding protein